jgi:hypothetical protein
VLLGWGLRQVAVGQIVELTGAKVETETVRVDVDGSVSISGLVLRGHMDQQQDAAILKAETVYARFGLGGLLLLRPRLKEIRVEDFVFDAQYDLARERWNTEALKIKFPRGGGAKPLVRLLKGRLRYSKVTGGKVRVVAAVPVEARLGPDDGADEAYGFEVATAKISGGYGKSRLTGLWQPGKVTFAGGLSSTDVAALEKVWTVRILAGALEYEQNADFRLKLHVKDLLNRYRLEKPGVIAEEVDLSKQWGPFAVLQRFFSRYRPAGLVDIELESSGNFRMARKSSLGGTIVCKDVSVCDRRFPYSVEHITGTVSFTENGLVLNDLRGEHGSVDVRFYGWSKGFGHDQRHDLGIAFSKMELDSDLYDALESNHKKIWSAFSPSGTAAVEYRAVKGPSGKSEGTLTVELMGTEATYEHFAYPLKNLRGKLLFNRGMVTVSDVVSDFEGRKITLGGRIWQPDEADKPLYELTMWAEQLGFEADWIGLLPATAHDIVSQFQPRGKIDVKVELNKTSDGGRPDYRVTVDCLGNSGTLRLSELSKQLVPKSLEWVSYPLENVHGIVVVTGDSIELRGINAAAVVTSEPSTEHLPVELNGRISLADGGFSGGVFTVSAEDVLLREGLAGALPESMSRMYSELSPAGRCDLILENITVGADAGGNRRVDVGGTVLFKDCKFNIGSDVAEMTGQLKLEFAFDGDSTSSEGRALLSADQLSIKGQYLKAVVAEIGYDRSRQSWVAKDIAAEFHGGKLAGKLELMEAGGQAAGYELQLGFDNIDLQGLARDLAKNSKAGGERIVWTSGVDLESVSLSQDKTAEHSSGKVNGSLCLSGRLGRSGQGERIGKCALTITDVQVGRLSPLAKLLYVLSLTEPTDFAFDRVLVDSYIKGDRVCLEHLDLSGAAVAFTGTGWMDLDDHSVDLLFFARGSRLASGEPSVLDSLTESLGSAVVRMEVTGDYHDPKVTTKTLPVLQQTLDLFSGKP